MLMTDRQQTGTVAPILRVEGLHKRFKGNRVLRGLTGSVDRGRATALIGSNGAGKSTFLNILSGLLKADEGRIFLNDADITGASGYMRARRGIGRTFQHPRSFRSLTVHEAVLMAHTSPGDEGIGRNLLRTFSFGFSGDAEAERRVRRCLEICRLDHRAQTPAAQLSYGEQKLLMLAQALAFDRDILCLDELCAGLEPTVVEHLRLVLVDLMRKGKTVIFVEHNLELVRELADNVIFLHEGTVYRSGDAASVLSDPDVVSLYLGD
jgi:ABC-type branched-subunit amino acid transport system ATPase component